MIRRGIALLLIVATCSCSRMPLRVNSQADELRRLGPANRLIVAAVDNRATAFMARAGGTPRAYDSLSAYGPTASARRSMAALAQDYALREVAAWPIEPLNLHCAVLEVAEGVDRDAILAQLAHDPRVKLAEPLQTFTTRTLPSSPPTRAPLEEGVPPYNDPYVGLERGFLQMNVAGAHLWSTGKGVTVAIIDTGADTLHPDLRGRVAHTANFVDADMRQFRRDRHGTEIAGVIAAVENNHEGIVGIAPHVRLAIFKACWQLSADADEANCNSFTIARALVAAFDAHVQIVNLSISGPIDPLLRELLTEGARRGILFVGAAARDALGLMDQRAVIQVASSERPRAQEPHVALEEPESRVVLAPGREILTLLPNGHYDFASGDSIATAQVSGVVALLLAAAPGLSAATVRRVLFDTSRHANAAAIFRGGERADFGVDACAAVAVVADRRGCADDLERRMASH